MASNIVAYVGIDNFDNILYLSRILIKLGKRVLIVDHSETKSLAYSIPQPEGVNSDNEVITYRKVDFTSITIDHELTTLYDDIFISYGYQEPMQDIFLCNRFVLVTNMYRFHYERNVSCNYKDCFPLEEMRSLLIRDALDVKITPDIIAERTKIPFPRENISILYLDEKDYCNGLVCHHNGVFRFVDISKHLKKYLIEEASRIHPEIESNTLKAACRQARKGE